MEGEVRAGGLWCREVLERLSDALDGLLPEEDRTRVAAHLRACRRCEALGGRVGRLVGDLRRELGVPDPLDPVLRERLLAALPGGRGDTGR